MQFTTYETKRLRYIVLVAFNNISEFGLFRTTYSSIFLLQDVVLELIWTYLRTCMLFSTNLSKYAEDYVI